MKSIATILTTLLFACGGVIDVDDAGQPREPVIGPSMIPEASADVAVDQAADAGSDASKVVCMGPVAVCPLTGCPCDTNAPGWGYTENGNTIDSCATCQPGDPCFFLSNPSTPIGTCAVSQ